jgi:O-antigen/teichoic acid export membrane protein
MEDLAVSTAASPLSAGSSQWRRLANVALLIGGYALGQGAIFAVQTWLVARGAYDLLSAFGTHFSFAMLSIFLIDAGSTTTLARQIARLSAAQTNDELWPVFWATVVVRAAIAMTVGVATLVYALAFSSDAFSRYYLLAILPGLAIWTGNAVGLLDGLRLSGLSGVTGSIAFATSATGLALAPNMPPGAAGVVLGCAFSIGYALTVVAQWTVLGRLGRYPRFRRPTRHGTRRALRDGLALLSQFAPGQLILRFQLVLSTAYLGTEATALFVYTKQAVIAMTMLVGFTLRVDFPGLVERMARVKEHSIRSIFEAQKSAMVGALFLSGGTLVACFAAPLVPQYNLVRAAHLLMAYAPSIITISAVLIMMQGMAATGNYVAGAKIMAISTLAGAIVSYLAIGPFGIYGLLIGEVSIHLLGLGLLYGHLRSLQ